MAVNYPINHHLYTFLWNKYRPVILKLMVDAAEEPQHYQFIQHEFKDINPKEKGGHSFTMEVFKSKPLNNIKGSVVAQDLLIMLEKSKKARELMEESAYELILDKHLKLHVAKLASEEVPEEEQEETESEEAAEERSDESSVEDKVEENSDKVSE
mgnify:CR=1 FL=1